jgi:hypothetical protein
MKEQGYETSVLLHWNAEKQREETWLHIGLGHSTESSKNIRRIATRELGQSPLIVVIAETYLNGNDICGSRNWLAGPITEEEVARL